MEFPKIDIKFWIIFILAIAAIIIPLYLRDKPQEDINSFNLIPLDKPIPYASYINESINYRGDENINLEIIKKLKKDISINDENEIIIKISCYPEGKYNSLIFLTDPLGNIQSIYPKDFRNTSNQIDSLSVLDIKFNIPNSKNSLNYGLWNINLILLNNKDQIIFQYSDSFWVFVEGFNKSPLDKLLDYVGIYSNT